MGVYSNFCRSSNTLPPKPDTLYVSMNGKSPIGDAAYDLLEKFRGKFESYRDAARAGKDPEAIHQMRVNARRLRACIRAFAPVLAQPVRELEPELRWIAVSLGEVRDADVHIERMPDVAAILRELKVARLAQLRHDLGSPRYANLAEALKCRIAVAVHDDPPLASAPVVTVAPDIVGLAYRGVKRVSAVIDESSEPASIHRLRKRAKRLRYTVDCFATLYGGPGKRFVATLKELQDLLGAHQDAIVAQALCAELQGRGADAELGHYSKEAQDVAEEMRAKVPAALDELAERWLTLKERMRAMRRQLWKS